MATFKCLSSGQTVTFTLQHDIDSMKGHQGYIRVDVPEDMHSEEASLVTLSPPPKRQGRPRKMENVGN
jgi:hypothetical protein